MTLGKMGWRPAAFGVPGTLSINILHRKEVMKVLPKTGHFYFASMYRTGSSHYYIIQGEIEQHEVGSKVRY